MALPAWRHAAGRKNGAASNRKRPLLLGGSVSCSLRRNAWHGTPARMIRYRTAVLLPLVALSLSGCLARTAVGVVTAPVRVAAKGVDWATTSQSEADEKRGREMRRREEKLGKVQRSYDKHLRQCNDGNDTACDAARVDQQQIQELLPTVPYERRR